MKPENFRWLVAFLLTSILLVLFIGLWVVTDNQHFAFCADHAQSTICQ